MYGFATAFNSGTSSFLWAHIPSGNIQSLYLPACSMTKTYFLNDSFYKYDRSSFDGFARKATVAQKLTSALHEKIEECM